LSHYLFEELVQKKFANTMILFFIRLQRFLITGFLHSSADRETEWIAVFRRRSSQLALLFYFRCAKESCGKAICLRTFTIKFNISWYPRGMNFVMIFPSEGKFSNFLFGSHYYKD